MNLKFRFALCGLCAGAVTGLLGTGGGMLLVPLLAAFTDLDEQVVFPCSVAIILPICVMSLMFALPLPAGALQLALPYLIGSVAAGFLSAHIGKRIPAKWLHRCLGLLILWGGIRYLC